ncbi:MAG: DUF4249 domain-containing protein [Bacteroidota bacterium]
MRKNFALAVLLFMVLACVDTIDVDLPSDINTVVVEGLVVSAQGESFVRLSTTTSVFIDNPGLDTIETIPLSGAIVEVINGSGDRAVFAEVEEGLYQPSAGFLGTVGETYRLSIKTSNGDEFVSETDTLYPAPELRRLLVEYEEDDLGGQLIGFHNFYVVLTNPSTIGYYRFSNRSVAEVFTDVTPPPYICGRDTCPVRCYSYREPVDFDINTFTNAGLAGDELVFQSDTEGYDNIGWYLYTARVYSLSNSAFTFWSTAQAQNEIGGSVFDPQISPLQSNIRTVLGRSGVTGFFGSSDYSEVDTVFKRGLSGPNFTPAIPVSDDCLPPWRGGSYVKPDKIPG